MRDLGVETADCYRGCFAADITEEVTRTLCRRRRHEAYFGGGQYWIEDPAGFVAQDRDRLPHRASRIQPVTML